MDVWPRERKQYHSDLFGNVIKWHAGGVLSIHCDGSRPVGLSYISFDLTASNEKKLGYLTGNKSLAFRWNQTGSRLNTWPLEEGQKYELVLIWSRELCELCWAWGRAAGGEGKGMGGRNRHKWSNYLRMRSLFGSISSRLWLREAQPAKQHNWLCYLIAESTSLCKDIFFFFFLKGNFVHSVCRLLRSS